MSNQLQKEFIRQLHEQMDILGISFDSDILSDFEHTLKVERNKV